MNNDKRVMVSVLIVTVDRVDDVMRAIKSSVNQDYPNKEIVVVVSGHNTALYKRIKNKYKSKVQLISKKEDEGVSSNRNKAIESAKGDILVTIDDDAYFESDKTLSNIVDTFREADGDVGALALKIKRHSDGEVIALPARNNNVDLSNSFEVASFRGAGHAILRKVYEDSGLYRDYDPYGHEELDLSLRIIDNGYKIKYAPSAVVKHDVSKNRSERKGEYWVYLLSHRVKVAIHNLPWRCVVSTLLAWSARIFYDSKFSIRVIVNSYKKILKDLRRSIHERKVISKKAFNYLKELNGPLYY